MSCELLDVSAEITHTAHDRSYATNEEATRNTKILSSPSPPKTPATPHRTTKRPKIEGTQVALVAGPEGEEVHPDEYGRIKVWLPWDRQAKRDGSDTCWIRVAQNWAGAGWGGQISPRIGMEVMVTYLDGDPDRPVVTGVVPNARQKVPYKLPENKTKSVFRTNTHKSKDKWQMNELTFEDMEGQEEVFIHAQKDLTVKVENHSTQRIDANKVVSVGGAEISEIEKSSNKSIGHNYTITVGSGMSGVTVRTGLNDQIFGIRPSGYFIDDLKDLSGGGGNFSVNAAGAIHLNAEKSATTVVSAAYSLAVGGVFTQTVGGSSFMSAAVNSTEIVGKKKVLEAHEEIMIRCGKSEIVLMKDGTIKISGVKLLVDEEERMAVKAGKIELN